MIKSFDCDNGSIENPVDIADYFNIFFSTVATKLASKIDPVNIDITRYIDLNIFQTRKCFIL